MKRLIHLSLIIFLAILIPPQNVLSQDFGENVKKRLEEVESKRSTASAQTATGSAQTRAQNVRFTTGTIVSINGNALIMASDQGSRIVYTVDSTKYFSLDAVGKRVIGFADLKLGEQVIILGIPPKVNSGTARFVIRDTTTQTRTFSALGRVTQISNSNLSLANLTREDLPILTLTINNETQIHSGEGSTLMATDLRTNDRIVAAGTVDNRGNLITQTILRLQSSTGSQEATSSAR